MSTRSALQQHIAEIAELFDWRHHQERRTSRNLDGYPDGFPSETLLRAGRLMFLVIAPASGRLSRQEAQWVEVLDTVQTVEVHVLRPCEIRKATRLLRADRDPEPEEAAA